MEVTCTRARTAFATVFLCRAGDSVQGHCGPLPVRSNKKKDVSRDSFQEHLCSPYRGPKIGTINMEKKNLNYNLGKIQFGIIDPVPDSGDHWWCLPLSWEFISRKAMRCHVPWCVYSVPPWEIACMQPLSHQESQRSCVCSSFLLLCHTSHEALWTRSVFPIIFLYRMSIYNINHCI